MKFFVAVLFVASASAFPSQLPAGVDPSLCPAELYPNCFITGVPSAAVAALPTPIVNGQVSGFPASGIELYIYIYKRI